MVLRDAVPSDAEALVEIWESVLRRGDWPQRVDDVLRVIADADADPSSRVLVAEMDGQAAGAVYLRVSTLTPVNLEPVVLALSPHVLPAFRRRGVGRSLMDAAVTWAEELGAGHVASAAVTVGRDANRFMARLGLGPQATYRVAPTGVVRAKLRPRGARQVSQVLAARRSQRQRQPTAGMTVRGDLAG